MTHAALLALLFVGSTVGGASSGTGALRGPGVTRGEVVLERRFTSELELATTSFDMFSDEDGRSVEGQGPRYVRGQSEEVELVDTLSDEDSPPQSFTRLYRTIASAFRVGAGETPREKSSHARLEGKSVTFERNDDGSWERKSDEVEARAGQLKRLRADLALTSFLPPDASEPEPGTSWEIPAAEILRLVSPVEEGRPRAREPKPERDGAKGAKGLRLSPVSLREPLPNLFAELDGTLEATWIEAPDDDELPCQARLVFRLESSFDGSAALIGENESASDVEDGIELGYEGTGTLGWDPESGTIELALEGDLALTESFQARLTNGEKSGKIRGRLVLEGTLAFEAREERAE